MEMMCSVISTCRLFFVLVITFFSSHLCPKWCDTPINMNIKLIFRSWEQQFKPRNLAMPGRWSMMCYPTLFTTTSDCRYLVWRERPSRYQLDTMLAIVFRQALELRCVAALVPFGENGTDCSGKSLSHVLLQVITITDRIGKSPQPSINVLLQVRNKNVGKTWFDHQIYEIHFELDPRVCARTKDNFGLSLLIL